VLNFAGGYFAGLVLAPLAIGLALAVVIAAVMFWPQKQTAASPRFLLAAAGRDISRAGGAVIQVRRSTDEVRQDCRDACDDLRLEGGRGALKAIRILDARGNCVSCQDMSSAYGARAARWRISGSQHLSIQGGDRE
jgi:hypothetical protein